LGHSCTLMNTSGTAMTGRRPSHVTHTRSGLHHMCWPDLSQSWGVKRTRYSPTSSVHPFRLRAQSTQQPKPEDSPPPQPGSIVTKLPEGRSVPRRPPPTVPLGTKLQRVEDLGEDSWAGVAGLDRKDLGDDDWTKTLILSAGDVICLLIFASIGRANHGEALTVGGAVQTALPFLLGWFAVAPFTGGLNPLRKDQGLLSSTALRWVFGIPLGIAFRSVSRGYIPETSFIIVSLAATAVLLGSWRALFANYISGTGSSSSSGSRNKRGNPFEFITLLISLVKRW
jgi:hypothetical protein